MKARGILLLLSLCVVEGVTAHNRVFACLVQFWDGVMIVPFSHTYSVGAKKIRGEEKLLSKKIQS